MRARLSLYVYLAGALAAAAFCTPVWPQETEARAAPVREPWCIEIQDDVPCEKYVKSANLGGAFAQLQKAIALLNDRATLDDEISQPDLDLLLKTATSLQGKLAANFSNDEASEYATSIDFAAASLFAARLGDSVEANEIIKEVQEDLKIKLDVINESAGLFGSAATKKVKVVVIVTLNGIQQTDYQVAAAAGGVARYGPEDWFNISVGPAAEHKLTPGRYVFFAYKNGRVVGTVRGRVDKQGGVTIRIPLNP